MTFAKSEVLVLVIYLSGNWVLQGMILFSDLILVLLLLKLSFLLFIEENFPVFEEFAELVVYLSTLLEISLSLYVLDIEKDIQEFV